MEQKQQSCHPEAAKTHEYDVHLSKDVFGLGIYFTESEGMAIVDRKVPFYRLPDGELAPGEKSGVIACGDILCAIDGEDLQLLSFPSIVEALRSIPTGDVTLTFRRPAEETSMRTRKHSKPSKEEVVTQSLGLEDKRDADKENKNEECAQQGEEKRYPKRWTVLQRLSSTAATIAAAATTSTSSPPASPHKIEFILDLQMKLKQLEETLDREKKRRFLAEKKNILYRNELIRLSEENAVLRYQMEQEKSKIATTESFCRSLHLAI